MTDNYKTISSTGEGLYKEKGSKFIAFAFPVTSEDEIKEIIAQFHKDYHNARHICYAYKLGYDNNSPFRINDDGEPSGTAGKPIYGQILSHELTDILIVVVRYFGGTKLGVSGLINAYKTASSEAINNTKIIEKIRQKSLTIVYGFDLTNQVMRIIKEQDLNIISQEFDNVCHLTINIRLNHYERIKKVFSNIYGVDIKNQTHD